MSAENAWRIAMEAAAAVLDRHGGVPCGPAAGWNEDEREGYENGQRDAAHSWQSAILSLPMPPAFRAAVEAEAEAEELRGMLAEARDRVEAARQNTSALSSDTWRYYTSLAGRQLGNLRDDLSALLSRLEAKGESHE